MRAWSDRTRGNGFKLEKNKLRLEIRNNLENGEAQVGQVLLPHPWSVQGQAGLGLEQPGLLEGVSAHGRGCNKIFEVLSNPNNSGFRWSFALIQLYLLKPALICNPSVSRKALNNWWGTHLQSPLHTQLYIIVLFYSCGNWPVARAYRRSWTCHQQSEPKHLWVLNLCHNQNYHCLYSLNIH